MIAHVPFNVVFFWCYKFFFTHHDESDVMPSDTYIVNVTKAQAELWNHKRICRRCYLTRNNVRLERCYVCDGKINCWVPARNNRIAPDRSVAEFLVDACELFPRFNVSELFFSWRIAYESKAARARRIAAHF